MTHIQNDQRTLHVLVNGTPIAPTKRYTAPVGEALTFDLSSSSAAALELTRARGDNQAAIEAGEGFGRFTFAADKPGLYEFKASAGHRRRIFEVVVFAPEALEACERHVQGTAPSLDQGMRDRARAMLHAMLNDARVTRSNVAECMECATADDRMCRNGGMVPELFGQPALRGPAPFGQFG